MSDFSYQENPLLAPWQSDFELPPFSLIKPSHYTEAISAGFSQHLAEIKAIAEDTNAPTFENTIASYDRAGGVLTKVLNVFGNQCSSNVSPELQAIELSMAGPLAEHETIIITFPGIFSRVDAVHASRHSADSSLSPEQIRLTERIHLDFIRAGAEFSPASQTRYTQIVMRLAEVMTQFAQNVLADEAGFTLQIRGDQLGGLPADLVDSAKQAAVERKLPDDCYAITLSRSLVSDN
jgi:peptidyl-dipeptidase Dcp